MNNTRGLSLALKSILTEVSFNSHYCEYSRGPIELRATNTSCRSRRYGRAAAGISQVSRTRIRPRCHLSPKFSPLPPTTYDIIASCSKKSQFAPSNHSRIQKPHKQRSSSRSHTLGINPHHSTTPADHHSTMTTGHAKVSLAAPKSLMRKVLRLSRQDFRPAAPVPMGEVWRVSEMERGVDRLVIDSRVFRIADELYSSQSSEKDSWRKRGI